MLEIIEPPAPHVLALRASGRIEADEVTRAADAIRALMGEHPRVSMFADLTGMTGMSAEALARDLRAGVSLMGELKRFMRAAVVTDTDWIAAIVRFENRIVPHIEMRVFGPLERAEALKWAAGIPAAPAEAPETGDEAPGVEMIPTSDPAALAFEITGQITSDDVHRIAGPMHEAFEAHGKVRMLARLHGWPSFEMGLLAERETWRMKLAALEHVERYAVVGGPDWLGGYVRTLNPLFRVEVRHFPEADEAAAWEWIGAKPALLAV